MKDNAANNKLTGEGSPSDEIITSGDATVPEQLAECSCGAAIPPGEGHCLVCGRFTVHNSDRLLLGLRSKKLAKIVDSYRIELIDELFRERSGKDRLSVVEKIAIENFALLAAQHKTIEARLDATGLFTQTGTKRSAFDMLRAISETLDRLRNQLPPVIVEPDRTTKGADATPTSAFDLGVALLKRQRAGDVLTDFERGQLDVIRASMQGDLSLINTTGGPHDDDFDYDDDDDDQPEVSDDETATPEPTPAPETTEQILARGRKQRAEEEEEADKRATAEMMAQLGRQLPWWYRR